MNPINGLPRCSPHSAPFDFALLACEDDIADRLFRLRRSLCLVRADMAARMGVIVREYCDFEDGFVAPGERALAALASSTAGLSLNWLIHGRGLPFAPVGREGVQTKNAGPRLAPKGSSACFASGGASPAMVRPSAREGAQAQNARRASARPGAKRREAGGRPRSRRPLVRLNRRDAGVVTQFVSNLLFAIVTGASVAVIILAAAGA